MKIFIIEDEIPILELYQHILGSAGFELEAAHDGLEALTKLKKTKKLPDLITLDLLMPRMNGYEFMQSRNKIPKLKDIPIVVITNLNLPEEQEKARKLGAVEFLVKTAQEPQEVVACIKNILSK